MTSPDTPPPRKRRRWPRVLAVIGLLLVAGLAATVVFRKEIAETAARRYLEGQGIAVGALEVTKLALHEIELRNIALGDAREVTVELLQIKPDVANRQAPLQTVTLQGVALRLDLREEAAALGSLQAAYDHLSAAPAAAAEPAQPFDLTRLPALALSDATVTLETPGGPMTAALNGYVTPSAAGDLVAEADLVLDNELGRLRAQLAGRRAAAGDLAVEAAIADGRLAWQDFRIGAFSGKLSAALPVEGAPRLDAVFDLAALAYAPADGPGLQLASGRLEAQGRPAEATLGLTLEGAEEQLSLAASARQDPSAEGLRTTFDIQGEVRSAGGLVRFLPLPGLDVAAGRLKFQGSGQGDLLGDTSAPATWQRLPDFASGRQLALRGDAVLSDVALADGSRGISARLPIDLQIAASGTTLTLREDADLRIGRPSRERLQALGLPDDILPLVASGLSLTLKAAGPRAFRLLTAAAWPPREAGLTLDALATSDQGLRLAAGLEGQLRLDEDLGLAAATGRIDARAEAPRLELDRREARDVRLALPLDLRYDETGLALSVTRPGALRIGQFAGGAPLRLQDPLDFTVSALTLETPPDLSGYSYRLSAGEDGANFAVTLAEAEPVPVEAGALGLRLAGSFRPDRGHDAALEIRLAGLGLPGYAFSAEAAEVDVTLDRELRPATSRFALGPLVVGGAEPLAAPLRLDGTLQRQGEGYDIVGILALAGGLRPVQPLADITARLSDRGEAEVEAVSRFITFDPDSLQPGDLSPRLAELKKVRGNLTAQASLAWPLDPATESGRLSLAGLSFESPVGAVEGLDLDVILTGLLPLASAPDQRLTIRRLDAAVPVEAVALVFALDQSPQPHLTVSDGGFDLGGARWRIAPTTLDPAARRNAVAFATEALDLATFFQLIEVEGLSGSGTLKGRIPIAFEGEDVIVEEGRFEALGPGRLQIRFAALRAALAGGGEYVEMAAQAMEDFHFDNLSITVSKTAANDATVRLSTLGRNPAVLDGQPFQFNINLESNLTSVLAALKEGYRLSDETLRRAWRLRE